MTIEELRQRLAGRRLRGNQNQCPSCGDLFGGFTAFDMHRVGEHGLDRRCRTPDEREAVGLRLDDQGFWRRSPPAAFVARRHNASAISGAIGQGVVG